MLDPNRQCGQLDSAQVDNRHSVVVTPPFDNHTLLQFVPQMKGEIIATN
jgi:hypothetical protein